MIANAFINESGGFEVFIKKDAIINVKKKYRRTLLLSINFLLSKTTIIEKGKKNKINVKNELLYSPFQLRLIIPVRGLPINLNTLMSSDSGL